MFNNMSTFMAMNNFGGGGSMGGMGMDMNMGDMNMRDDQMGSGGRGR